MTIFRNEVIHALKILIAIDNGGEKLVNVHEIATQVGVSRGTVEQVCRKLSDLLIEGQRGPGGGYRLLMPLESITVLDVMRAITKTENTPPLPLWLDPVEKFLVQRMETITLHDLQTHLKE